MTVKELIKELKEFDKDMEIRIHSGGYSPKGIGRIGTPYVIDELGHEYKMVVIHGS